MDKTMPFLVLVVFFCFVVSAQIVVAQSHDEELSEYLLKYDDFYKEYAFSYRCEQWGQREKSVAAPTEIAWITEGMVVASAKSNIRYGGYSKHVLGGPALPLREEVLYVDNRVYHKGYRISIESGGDFVGQLADEKTFFLTVSLLQPHALCLLREREAFGNSATMTSLPKLFFQAVEPLDREETKDGIVVRWKYPKTENTITIRFSSDTKLPIETTFIFRKEGKPSEIEAKYNTVTKWAKFDADTYVPKEMSLVGKDVGSEIHHAYEIRFLKTDEVKERFSKISSNRLVRLPGTGWWDEFSDWFEKDDSEGGAND